MYVRSAWAPLHLCPPRRLHLQHSHKNLDFFDIFVRKMIFIKLLFLAAYARAEIDEEALEESGITAQDVYNVIIDNDNIQTFIETNELTFNVAEGDCDEVNQNLIM